MSSYVPAPRTERNLPADDDEEAEDEEEEEDDLADGLDDMDVDEDGPRRSKAKYMRILVSSRKVLERMADEWARTEQSRQ